MVIAKYVTYYVLAWLATVILLAAVPGKTRDQIATCKCGKDFRIASRDLCLLVLLWLPISFPVVIAITLATFVHKKRCLVNLVDKV